MKLKRRESKKEHTRRRRKERQTKGDAIRTVYSEMIDRYKFISALSEILYASDHRNGEFNCECIILDGKKNRMAAACEGVMATTFQNDLPLATLVIRCQDAHQIIKELEAVDNVGAIVEMMGTKNKPLKLRFTSGSAAIEVDIMDRDFPSYRELMKPLPDNMFIVYKSAWKNALDAFSKTDLGRGLVMTVKPTYGKVELSPVQETAFGLKAVIDAVSVGTFEPFDIEVSKFVEIIERIAGDRVHFYKRQGCDMLIVTSSDASSKLDIYDVKSVHVMRP